MVHRILCYSCTISPTKYKKEKAWSRASVQHIYLMWQMTCRTWAGVVTGRRVVVAVSAVSAHQSLSWAGLAERRRPVTQECTADWSPSVGCNWPARICHLPMKYCDIDIQIQIQIDVLRTLLINWLFRFQSCTRNMFKTLTQTQNINMANRIYDLTKFTFPNASYHLELSKTGRYNFLGEGTGQLVASLLSHPYATGDCPTGGGGALICLLYSFHASPCDWSFHTMCEIDT